MSTVEQPVVVPVGEDSDIIHLTCCRDSHPTRALCGWDVTEEARVDDPGPECVVCCDIADGVGPDDCVRGGRCPE